MTFKAPAVVPVGNFSGGSMSSNGGLVSGPLRRGSGGARPWRWIGFQESFEVNEKLTIIHNFNGNFFVFVKLLKLFYRIFRENLGRNLENLFKYAFLLPGGGPVQIENLLNLVEKSMETCSFLKFFINYEIFYISKSILIKKIKAC